jgi:hypothetical protein
MKKRLLSNCCIAFFAALLTGCGSHLSGVYEADYRELMSQQANSASQMYSALSPFFQAVPGDTRRRLEQQQQQTVEQISSLLAGSLPPLRLDFSWGKVTSSCRGVETTCSYSAGRDYVLISQKNDSTSLRFERRSDGTLAWNGLVFRQILGSASSGSPALLLWIVGGLAFAISAGASLWYLQRRGILGEVVLFFDEHFVVPKEGKHETLSCKVVPMPPSALQDDSRFMASGVGKLRDDTRFMPPEALPTPAPSNPPAPAPPKP